MVTRPTSTGCAGRRMALIRELAPQIDALFARPVDAATAVAEVMADTSLSSRERQIALQLILARGLRE